ncbi:MAG: TonB-dependent receptor [Oceanospirillaceae bacterium]|nr:TonB-dependent receptor [Oceanospirillaceae bacterium]MCP5351537.1 TonB-dependent receptor [Oceanospirillaceae bacterium]
MDMLRRYWPLAFTVCLYSPFSQAEDDLDFGAEQDDMPVVLTAVRLRQAQIDTPASVTVLDAEFIRRLGVTSLADVFRFVPGMMVGYDSNTNMPVVHYHGGPASFPRNLQVLLDGRSVYKSAIASVVWNDLPVAIEDIERIEIVRGPNASTYGTNAYQAVINILTKHPADTYGAEVRYRTGSNNNHVAYARQGGRLGSGDYRVSLSRTTDGGFEDSGPQYGDDHLNQFVDAQYARNLADMSELRISAIAEASRNELPIKLNDDMQLNQSLIEHSRYEVGLQWKKDISADNRLQVKAYFSREEQKQCALVGGEDALNLYFDDDLAALYQSNPALPAILAKQATGKSLSADEMATLAGATPAEQALMNQLVVRYSPAGQNQLATISGEVNTDLIETRSDIEVQNIVSLGQDTLLMTGASFRRDGAESDAYFDGGVHNDTYRLFGSLTHALTPALRLHLGLMVEDETDLEPVVAPRIAFNYRLADNHGLRLVYSEAVRSPDAVEQQARLSYQLENAQSAHVFGTTFYQQANAEGGLLREKISSTELGYYGLSDNAHTELDVRLFHEELRDVLVQSLRLDNFYSENSNHLFFRGIEAQLKQTLSEQSRLQLAAAWIDAGGDQDEEVYLRVFARRTLNLALLQDWQGGFKTSLAYYLADKFNDFDNNAENASRFERLDLNISKSWMFLRGAELETGLYLQHDLNSDGLVFRDQAYADLNRVLFTAGIQF